MMKKTIISTPKAPAAIGPYSQGYIAGDLVFTAGQAGLDPETGRPVSALLEAQADQACRNLGAILEAAGASYDDVVKATVFLSNMAYFDAFNAVYAKYFTKKPARTCVAVKELPLGLLCEIEVIACKD